MLLWMLLSLLFILQWLYWKSSLRVSDDDPRVKMGLQKPKGSSKPPQFHIVFSTGCNAFQDCTLNLICW
jgi:hypothetical protein